MDKMWFNRILLLISSFTTCELSITFRETPESYPSSDFVEPCTSNPTLQQHVAFLGLKTLSTLPEENANIVLSPVNIYSCLGILGLGAAGETKHEIARILGPASSNCSLNSLLVDIKDISYASAVFLDSKSVAKFDFINESAANFQAPVISLNFTNGEESAFSINRWVSDHTNGTIPDLLQGPLDSATKSVIVSTLYFNGLWEHPFMKEATTMRKFHISENTSVELPFMVLEASLPLLKGPDYEALELPYQGNGLSMHLVLPRVHGMQALKQILSQLGPEHIKQLRKNCTVGEIIAVIPKLKTNGRLYLKESLQKQGLTSMFLKDKADFSNLVELNGSPLFVSEIYHNVHFEMNEEGTRAAAASAAIATKSSKIVFRADRPFIFIVTHKTGLVLFMGIIVKPN